MTHLCQGCLRRDSLAGEEEASGDGVSVRLLPSRTAEKLRNQPKRAPGRV